MNTKKGNIIQQTAAIFILSVLLWGCKQTNKHPISEINSRVNLKMNTVKEKKDKRLIAFWNIQRKGCNYFNGMPTKEWFESADKANIRLVRFTYDKWKGEQRDFLMGNADNYQGLVEKDLIVLKQFLDMAADYNIKVVLTPIGLPGARFIQNNKGKRDGRLWKEEKYQKQAIQYWVDLATQLKGHPAIVGYNLKNEPVPEWFYNKRTFWDKGFIQWYKKIKGTPGDLNQFNKRMVAAIRKVDAEIPIIVESGLYATPWAFEYLEPIDDDKIIYSFHMYEPYEFSTKHINKGRYTYPGEIPIETLKDTFVMNKKSLQAFFSPVIDWCEKNNIPSNRIWVGEFGCHRFMPGAKKYLEDLISIFNQQQWHWAFYAFREDVWSGMDYELGSKKPFWKYWDYQEAKTLHLHYDEIYGKVKNNTLWPIFKKELQP